MAAQQAKLRQTLDAWETLMICEHFRRHDIRAIPTGDINIILIAGQPVGIVRTDCHFGGSRAWFECPFCLNRCAILYEIGEALKCRKCGNLRYRTESRSPARRALLKAFKIRRQLGQEDPNLFSPFPEKPKYMRWATYERHRRQCAEAQHIWFRQMLGFVELEQMKR